MSVVVYAPAGAGKTLRADELLRRFGLRAIVDEWCPGMPLAPDELALTNVPGIPGALVLADVS